MWNVPKQDRRDRDAKSGRCGRYICVIFSAGANFWAISAILGHFWAILGNFGSFLGHFFVLIFFGKKFISAIFITFCISTRQDRRRRDFEAYWEADECCTTGNQRAGGTRLGCTAPERFATLFLQKTILLQKKTIFLQFQSRLRETYNDKNWMNFCSFCKRPA